MFTVPVLRLGHWFSVNPENRSVLAPQGGQPGRNSTLAPKPEVSLDKTAPLHPKPEVSLDKTAPLHPKEVSLDKTAPLHLSLIHI